MLGVFVCAALLDLPALLPPLLHGLLLAATGLAVAGLLTRGLRGCGCRAGPRRTGGWSAITGCATGRWRC